MGERGPKGKFTDVSCNNRNCKKYGICGEDNIVGNGTSTVRGGISQRFFCKECGHYFNIYSDTAYNRLRSDPDKVDGVIKCLNEGMSIRSTARAMGCSVSTVQRWLKRAAGKADEIEIALENNLEPKCVQFDEMTDTLKKTFFETQAFQPQRPLDMDFSRFCQQISARNGRRRARSQGGRQVH